MGWQIAIQAGSQTLHGRGPVSISSSIWSPEHCWDLPLDTKSGATPEYDSKTKTMTTTIFAISELFASFYS